MKQERVRVLNTKEVGNGPVLYWMDRDMRICDNWALHHAQTLAQKRGVALLVIYNLVTKFLGGGERQLAFKLDALEEIELACKVKNIPFFLLVDTHGSGSAQDIVRFAHEHAVGTIVTDFSPLRMQREWKEHVAKKATCEVLEVDAHNIVPAWIASPKQEFGAYTLRPKLHRLLPAFLDTLPKLMVEKEMYIGKIPNIDWKKLRTIGLGQPTPVTWCRAGEKAGRQACLSFIENRLVQYAAKRNDAMENGQSNLSPYVHYGMISPQRIALSVLEACDTTIEDVLDAHKNKAKVDESAALTLFDHAAAFLEELIVRRELADNYCLYNAHYDSYEGAPAWAKKSLEKHRKDVREYAYTKKQFEEANTHDDLWNAAQMEMVETGKMHGYMRMYWAKKILEWTKDIEEAYKIAIYLNDTYELDGRDPNGYAGIAWSIAGAHDRAWFERPVFGMIRFMARSGCEKKFNVKKYIAKWNKASAAQTLF